MSKEVPEGRVSIRDIAKQVGVSHATVSLALRNHPRISAALREKIKRMAEEMGYRPDPMLAALAHYRRNKTEAPITACLAWINACPGQEELRSHPEYDAYWQGARAAAGRFGYRLEEFRIDGDLSPQRLHQVLGARGIHGILLPPHPLDAEWKNFPWEHYSVVRFGRALPDSRAHLVASDQVANTLLAFEKIREHGYRRIGFVTSVADGSEHGILFESGTLAAQRFADPEERLPLFFLGNHAPAARQKTFTRWLEAESPDAIFTDSPDLRAMIESAGLRVPGDIGIALTNVTGTNDAGIDPQAAEVGRVGLVTLNSLIQDAARGVPNIFRQILVEGSWVDGGSLPKKTTKKAR